MTSHHSPHLFGRVPVRKPVQHHLPPLLPSSFLHSTESLPSVDSQRATSRNSLHFLKMSSCSGCSLPRNYCSVSTVGSVTSADVRRASGHNSGDAVSYIVAHQLPELFNSMIEDLLLERPEEDVDGWMTSWFEDAYKRRQSERSQRSAQRCGARRQLLRLESVVSGGNSEDGFLVEQTTASTVPNVHTLSRNTPPVRKPRGTSTDVAGVVSTRQRNSVESTQCTFVKYQPYHIPTMSVHGPIIPQHNDVSLSTENPVATTSTAQQARLCLTASSGGVVVVAQRGGDCRLKLRSPHTVDISNSDESFTSSLT